MGKINTKNILPGCIFTVLLFLMCLEYLTDIPILQTFFKHIDELLVLSCIVYLVLHIHYVFQKKWLLLYLWLGFMSIGAISSLIFHYQPLIPALTDALVVISKFIIGYLTAYVYASLHPKNLSQRLIGTARLITTLLFLISVHDLLMPPFFPRGEYRYFTQSLSLMFPHPTYLSAAMVALLVVLGCTDHFHKNTPYMLMATFIGMMTLRGKAIAFFAVYWILYICIMVFKNRHYTGMLIGGGLGSAVIGFEQIYTYFFNTSHFSPRRIMFNDSISLALQHFPLGTGFGTYGSASAAQNYSPLYTNLGYTTLDGMSPENTAYLYDCFWPEIFAQFGVIGTILFAGVLILLLVYSIRSLKKNRIAGFSMLMILVNMLINSMAESSFFNPTSLLLFAIFGLIEVETTQHPSVLQKGGLSHE